MGIVFITKSPGAYTARWFPIQVVLSPRSSVGSLAMFTAMRRASLTVAERAKDQQSRLSYTRLAEALETEDKQIARTLARGEGAVLRFSSIRSLTVSPAAINHVL